MSLYQKNKPFFLFLIKFVLSYGLLSFFYYLYLNTYDVENFEPDGMTTVVAKQSKSLLIFFGEDAEIEPHPKQASYKFYIKEKYVARIVEGCNAVSVMILFTAFIVAFSSTLKKTFLYILSGLLIIHILNVVRVGLLCMGFYYYPEYNDLTHDIIFPLFIYGVVFALWVLWVQKISGYDRKSLPKNQ